MTTTHATGGERPLEAGGGDAGGWHQWNRRERRGGADQASARSNSGAAWRQRPAVEWQAP